MGYAPELARKHRFKFKSLTFGLLGTLISLSFQPELLFDRILLTEGHEVLRLELLAEDPGGRRVVVEEGQELGQVPNI